MSKDFYPPRVRCTSCGKLRPEAQVRPPNDRVIAKRGVCTTCQPPTESLEALLRFK